VKSVWRLAVDIGGTFTDIVLLDVVTGRVAVEKILTTPSAPLNAVRTGVMQLLSRVGVVPSDIEAPIVHATTLITNALIERKVGRAAMVTTAGFGDTMLIRDEHRYDMYDLQIEFPEPPISRDLTFEIDERTAADGTVLVGPSDSSLFELTTRLAGADVEAVAVCFLNSYVNGANERSVAEHLRAELGVPVCVSSDVSPQIREYPRMITTACNASTMPVIGPYLEELQKWLAAEGFGGSVLMMLSNGGVVSAADAALTPIRLVESGPAAGALAGKWFADRHDEDRLLCFDMGGTTAKACLIDAGEPKLTNDFEVARAYRHKKGSGFPVSVPSVDLVEIGAGGGSLASLDHFGLLKVGPKSAGADPGPACYGNGGELASVTDADVVLGLLEPAGFLGGDMALDASLARSALETIAAPLGISVVDTAAGVHEVVNQNMAAAARMHAVEQGLDMRGVPIIAFGGAGPVHACGVAELLDSDRVIFPVNASVLSAFGTLVSPVRIDLARSLLRRLDTIDGNERDLLLDELRLEGVRILSAAGVATEAVKFRYGIDARYEGQGNEITIWLGEGPTWPVDDVAVSDLFDAEYRRIYGLTIPDVNIEVVTWRLSAFADAHRQDDSEVGPATDDDGPDTATRLDDRGTGSGHSPRVEGVAREEIGFRSDAVGPTSRREVVFARATEPVEVDVYQRSDMTPGVSFAGPAIIEERETTIVIRPGWSVQVAFDRSIVATRGDLR